MKEKELINIIKTILDSKFIGDDCAYLKDIGIVITQDSLIEGIHFSLEYTTAYQLGWKSVMVNISDVCASGAEPKYLTVALSLPNYVNESFVKDFYEGAKAACGGIKIVGGDITGSDKVYISITAIGLDKGRWISSRANAKVGYKIIVSGEHGNSAYGLKLLQSGLKESNKYTEAHLMPVAKQEFSKQIAQNIDCDYAMMDSSDGLADALIQIAKLSGVKIKIETSKIPHDKVVELDTVLYGGEDYQLVAAVPEEFLSKISHYTIIGEVTSGDCGIDVDGQFYSDLDDKIYNHFEVKNED